jgi:iron complex transport system ATP-binding protein
MSLLLTTHDLAIGYVTSRRTKTVVADAINVALRPGELVALIGPNGAGKSTLLRTLAGMQAPLRGRVALGGADLHRLPPRELAQKLAVVLTERVEAGNLSAYALAALGRHPYTDWRGALRAEDEDVVRRALTLVGAQGLAGRPVIELSDGERQRVMIARALAQQPEVLILDEPTAFLDLPRRVEIMQLLERLARQTQCAILLSTHDLELALRVADRLWLLPVGGPLTTGLPEALALDGVLGAIFQGEGVEWDSVQGGFKLHRHPCGPIGLLGEGLPALWTARALERIGFEVKRDARLPFVPAAVEVVNRAAPLSWRVITPGRTDEHNSLEAMIESVRR